MVRDIINMSGTGTESVAILVHGTFAGDDHDSGVKWWQHGSEAASQIQARLSGKELVHTSYFEHAEILELICCNISFGSRPTEIESTARNMDPQLADWFADAKFQTVGQRPVLRVRVRPRVSTATHRSAA
ncbi:hypothetical protein [Novipirellula artificiosorum]|uniref:Uncharacterized protein n=1 Tax=Novipirellula artificiosorum TaxID=2528016 RepID=A0A5C6D8T7_9BACT|nr:hypothetical protein [Novipirellula artificiosorum]TWU33260.1 hypothetical protein Poly41_50120 [Novipirellula artificiosorum]